MNTSSGKSDRENQGIEREMSNKSTYWYYYWKALKWYLSNLIFGLVPVILLLVVQGLSNGKVGGEGVNTLMNEGVLHFLSIALMGSVVTDALLSGEKSKGFEIFAIYIFPVLVLSFVALEYLLVYLRVIENSCFDINSFYTIIVILLSFGYCSFVKTSSYIKNSTKIFKP